MAEFATEQVRQRDDEIVEFIENYPIPSSPEFSTDYINAHSNLADQILNFIKKGYK